MESSVIPLDTIASLHATLTALLASITPDHINGAIEAVAGFFVLNHCRVLYAHKETRGVSIVSSLFFMCWGFWNLYYYPHLNQPISYYGGLFVVTANALYIGMMVRYHYAERLPL